ncbi:MAG: Fic family protein [Micrococcales bacterium]|nr:Fic family protein [Micrococcales bacterium]
MSQARADAALAVPPIEHEEHHWVVADGTGASRTARNAGTGPYRSAVVPPIAGYRPTLPGDLAADVEEAAAALASFDAYARSVFGSGSPMLGPMGSVLLRTESASSSQIENLTVSARQLAMAEIDQSSSTNAKVVVANVRSMETALELADRLDEDAVLAMHACLLAGQRGWERFAGTYRDSLVWIGTSRVSPRGASHVAPQPGLVRPAMADLVAFVSRDDLPVLVQAAVAHAQFETIHPFVDGNGRTGRALVHALLHNKGLVTSTTAPVSAGLLRHSERYFDALGTYRAGDARPIVERFTDAARYAASSGARLVDDLAAQLEESRTKMAGLHRNAGAWKVLPHLVAHPVVNARYLVNTLAMNDTGAQRALAALTTCGVLEERTGLRRNRVWQHQGILTVLDQYSEGLRRA